MIGCGHQEPETLDLLDDDGDLIANAYEAEDQKSIAQIIPMDKIKGELIVKDGDKIIAVAEIHNWKIDEQGALRVLRGERRDDGPEEFFRESHGLRLAFSRIPSEHTTYSVRTRYSYGGESYQIKTEPEKHDHRNYSLSVSIAEGAEHFGVMELIHEAQRINLHSQEIPITGKVLRQLYLGDSFLEVTRNERESEIKRYIKERCRKVYVSEGELNDVFFLSKSKDLHFLKESIGIRENPIDSLSGAVLRKDSDSFGIFSRSVPAENYHVIMRTKSSVVQKTFIEDNRRVHTRLERHDGTGHKEFIVENASDYEKTYFLHLKLGGHTKRTFRDFITTKDFGRERDHSCYTKKIEQSGVEPIASTALGALSELMISVNGSQKDLSLIKEFKLQPQDSSDLIIGLTLPPGLTNITLRGSQLGTQNVGGYESSYGCQNGHRSTVSVEVYFGLELYGFFEE